MNIYQKLSNITQEISNVAKNLNVDYGQSSYKAVGEADVLAAVRPLEAKYGVYSYPLSRDLTESSVLTSIDRNGNEKKNQFMRLKVVYRFVNTEDPTEFVDVVTYGDGVDPGDKAPGKAMTYADKYALLKAYKIITGDDPDQKESETLKDVRKKKITDVQALALTGALEAGGIDIPVLLKQYGCEKATDLTQEQHADIIRKLERHGRKT